MEPLKLLLPDKDPVTLDLLQEIGQVLGIGESRVYQFQTQALLRLKGRFRKEELRRW